MESLKGTVAKEDIVHEHDGFRNQIHDMQSYLVSCLPAGTKWGFEDDVVSSPSTETFNADRLEKLIEGLVAAFIDHVRVHTSSFPFNARHALLIHTPFSFSSALSLDILIPLNCECTFLMLKWRPSTSDCCRLSYPRYVDVSNRIPQPFLPLYATVSLLALTLFHPQFQPPSFHVFSYIHRPSNNFPPMPWFVRILANWVWYWPDRKMWRFAPTISY